MSAELDKSGFFWGAPFDIDKLAAQQGIGPMDWQKWMSRPPAWPEDETIDEFTDWLRNVRNESPPDDRT